MAASDIQASINRNNHKLTADKIIQILDQVRDDAEKSNRRWVWELMQNAKDVANAFGRVSIEIRLTDDALTFAHNGNPFHVEHITGLIQQVSSKISDSSDEEITGKFGTGFISTHLLSSVIDVQGVVQREAGAHRKFTVCLDRSGTTSEELLDSISDSLDRILTLDHDETAFPLIPDYPAVRRETDLHTVFSYGLSDAESQEAATAGLADLVHTLPSTLVNLYKLKQVRVVHPNGAEQTYHSERTQEEGPIAWYTVRVTDSEQLQVAERHFLAYETPELRLLAEVIDFETLTLVPPTGQQPMLYRDFPLIGSERFHFPFTLNGFNFYPTEQRNGLMLNGESEKPTHNRALILAAREAALAFTDWLIEHGARNRYVLANTRIPESGMDTKTKAWYEGVQREWRETLLDKPLVENHAGTFTALRNTWIPRTQPGSSQADNDALWAIAVDFYDAGVLPQRELVGAWVKALGVEAELDNWNYHLLLDADQLLFDVAEKATVEAIQDTDELSTLAWLNRLYTFLSGQKKLPLLDTYAAVPNQRGVLRKLPDLYVERPKELIAAEILDVLETLGELWRDDLLHRAVLLPGITHRERGLREASTRLNELLNQADQKGVPTRDFLNRPDAVALLVALLRLTTVESKDDTYRSRLFGFAKEILHFPEEPLVIDGLAGFSSTLTIAARLLTYVVNEAIEQSTTVTGLSKELGKDQNQTINWLNDYLVLLETSGADYAQLIKDGDIVPNRLGDLCAYTDIMDYGTPEQELDDELISILHEFEPNNDLRSMLVADGIFLDLKIYYFENLCQELMMHVNDIRTNGQEQEYPSPLLRLIEWCEGHRELAQLYLKQFTESRGSLFFTLTIQSNPERSADVMRLMRNPEMISDLAALSESGADLGKLRELAELPNIDAVLRLAELVPTDAVMARVLEYANDLRREHSRFKHLQRIGAMIEEAFRQALLESGIAAEFEHDEQQAAEVKYRGIGSYDFAVVNPTNGKSFYIELKSYKVSENPHPIRLAFSQARRAATSTEPFALCVVRRHQAASEVTPEHVRENLTYVKDLAGSFASVVKDIDRLEAVRRQGQQVWVELNEVDKIKVLVSHKFIEDHGHPFESLIEDIRAALA